MNARTRNNRTIWNLLILLLIVSVTGTMLSCTWPNVKPGADCFAAPSAAPQEPVLGSVHADDFHDADPEAGFSAMQTLQSRLLTLSRATKEKQDCALYLAVLLLCRSIACGLCMRHFLRPNLSRLIPRRRTVIIYIYSQDGPKA